ncbi:hypothetical protein PG987_009422 [Apiospora arundinis]
MASAAKPSQEGLGETEMFPIRPGYGGTEFSNVPRGNTSHPFGHTLLTNYFSIDPPASGMAVAWKRYSIQVQATDNSNDAPKGFKLRQLIKQALSSLGISESQYATDFKDQVIVLKGVTPKKLDCKESFTNDRGVVKYYDIKLVGETEISFSKIKDFLGQKQELPAGNPNPYTCLSEILDAAGIVLGHGARDNPGINSLRSGRYFPFHPVSDDNQAELTELLMVIRGYFQSVRPASTYAQTPQPRLLPNANVAYGVFRRPRSLQDIFNNKKHFQPEDEYHELINRQLAKAKIVYAAPVLGSASPQERNKVMLGLADSRRRNGSTTFSQGVRFGRPKQVSFVLDGQGNMSNSLRNWYNKQNKSNVSISVFDYFKLQFNMNLTHNLPLIDIGTPQKSVFVPAELCKVRPGQLVATKLDSESSTKMINFACKVPSQSQSFIKGTGRRVLQLDGNDKLTKLQLSVKKELVEVKGRLLRAPLVQYLDEAAIQKSGGGWDRQAGNGVFKASEKCIDWMCVHIHREKATKVPEIQTALDELGTHLEDKLGLNINREPKATFEVVGGDEPAQFDGLRKKIQQRERNNTLPSYLVAVLPFRSPYLYKNIKVMGDVEYGFHTVCITKAKLLKLQTSTWDGLGFKLNLKAGGVNHQLDGKDVPTLIKKGETMFVGYDVTHPTNLDSNKKASKPNNSKGEGEDMANKMGSMKLGSSPPSQVALVPPSQVALVASVDKDLGQWPVVTWKNPGTQEMVNELKTHFLSRLELYFKQNGKLPKSIVIYRDGVSEGQYEQVTSIELPQIRNACEEALTSHEMKGSIPITLVVAVKRHQTRFYPPKSQDKTVADRNGNTKAGFVVDNSVTVKSHWDFYLQAHAAIQGTARPAHYTVLHDEIFRKQFAKPADHLEQVTHCISYAYGRATKAVSLCTPAYYADMACTRARDHMWELYDTHIKAQRDQGTIVGSKVHENLKDSMYYI